LHNTDWSHIDAFLVLNKHKPLFLLLAAATEDNEVEAVDATPCMYSLEVIIDFITGVTVV
jgi:hypothetical protein